METQMNIPGKHRRTKDTSGAAFYQLQTISVPLNAATTQGNVFLAFDSAYTLFICSKAGCFA